MPDLTVVYEAGILRPTSPIAFPEGQTLQIRILDPESLSLRFEQALQTLVATGALTNPTPDPTQPLLEINLTPLSTAQIETYGPNPVSDIIISDRGSL